MPRSCCKARSTKHPTTPTCSLPTAACCSTGDDLEGARTQFARVVELDPENPGGLYSLALLELETEQYKAGEKHLMQLLEMSRMTRMPITTWVMLPRAGR